MGEELEGELYNILLYHPDIGKRESAGLRLTEFNLKAGRRQDLEKLTEKRHPLGVRRAAGVAVSTLYARDGRWQDLLLFMKKVPLKAVADSVLANLPEAARKAADEAVRCGFFEVLIDIAKCGRLPQEVRDEAESMIEPLVISYIQHEANRAERSYHPEYSLGEILRIARGFPSSQKVGDAVTEALKRVVVAMGWRDLQPINPLLCRFVFGTVSDKKLPIEVREFAGLRAVEFCEEVGQYEWLEVIAGRKPPEAIHVVFANHPERKNFNVPQTVAEAAGKSLRKGDFVGNINSVWQLLSAGCDMGLRRHIRRAAFSRLEGIISGQTSPEGRAEGTPEIGSGCYSAIAECKGAPRKLRSTARNQLLRIAVESERSVERLDREMQEKRDAFVAADKRRRCGACRRVNVYNTPRR